MVGVVLLENLDDLGAARALGGFVPELDSRVLDRLPLGVGIVVSSSLPPVVR
jgi:hypothetical protein